MPAPLSALLSQVLVALTVEIDNTYESRAPHHTQRFGSQGPWLVSYGFWANLLRLVTDEAISVRELSTRAGTERVPHPSLNGMIRWGYVYAGPDGARLRQKDPRPDWLVQATSVGRTCSAISAEVPGEVEARWRARLGAETVDALGDQARSIVATTGLVLPGYLPQLGPRLYSPGGPSADTVPGPAALITALSNLLHAFALEAEDGLPLGLAALANTSRVLGDDPRPERDLPSVSGIAKESSRWASGVLERDGYLATAPDPVTGRGRVLSLTPTGLALRARYEQAVGATEDAWAERFGPSVTALRDVLEYLVEGDGAGALRAATVPPEGSWRARVGGGAVLPHFPFVSHRGGYPDGA
ncbi:MAG: hypothetical protein ACRDYB_02730 [Acidimicrobiales bacterium]